MATYNELVGVGAPGDADYEEGMIRAWANRDAEILSTTLCQQFARWSADKCYRKLRVPSLEFTRTFTIEDSDFVDISDSNLVGLRSIRVPVPVDLIELIYMRLEERVANEKIDNRTFYDSYAIKKSDLYWTRDRNDFYITGTGLQTGTELDVHYYRRLPALNANYRVLAATYNIDNQVYTRATDQTGIVEGATDVLWFPTGTNISVGLPNATASDSRTEDNTVGLRLVGNEIEHWLRDENERIILFGALMEAFSYLGDLEEFQKYEALFMREIDELNMEETMRQSRGGNVSVNFSSRLI